jgi:hypothetical protein
VNRVEEGEASRLIHQDDGLSAAVVKFEVESLQWEQEGSVPGLQLTSPARCQV